MKAVVAGAVFLPKHLVDTRDLVKRLTVKQWLMGERDTASVSAYYDAGKYIAVPRDFGLKLIANSKIELRDCRVAGESFKFPRIVKHTGEYEYQHDFVQKILDCARTQSDFLVQAATGKGKTICSLSVAQKLGKTALVVVDQDNLMQQWKKECKAALGLKDSQIGTVQGPECDYQGKGVTVAMMQSLVGREYPSAFYDYFGTVIFDEVHTAGAPTFSEALMLFPAKTRFGISATVERGDSLQEIIHWNLGSVAVELADTHDGSYLYYIESDTVYSWYANISPKVGRIISEVSNDSQRNDKIVKAIQWLYDTGRDVLVISDRIEQLENLMAMSYYRGIPEVDMGLYCGFSSRWVFAKDPKPPRRPFGYHKGTAYTPVKLTLVRKRTGKAALAGILKKARVIFATFGMFSKGVDVKRLSGGIDCTARSKAQQVHGRILRRQKGKPVPVWVTVRDINSYRLEYQFLKRIDEYEASSAEIYRWNLNSNGVRLADVKELKRAVRRNIKGLKALNIITSAGGNYMLTTQPMQK